MADPLLGLGIAQAIGNPLFGHLTNVQNRKFTREMYGRQRQDALADWDMQNMYNSPRQQMQRFQEAGLNPNLIYGQQTNSPAVRSASGEAGSARAPQMDMGAIMDLKQRSAQSDLLGQQLKLSEEDLNLRKAQTYLTIVKSDLTEVQKRQALLDLGISTELRETTIAGRKESVDQLKLQNDKLYAETWRAWDKHPKELEGIEKDNALKAQNLINATLENTHIAARIDKLLQDIKIDSISELEAEKGINPNNPAALKVLERLIEEVKKESPEGADVLMTAGGIYTIVEILKTLLSKGKYKPKSIGKNPKITEF